MKPAEEAVLRPRLQLPVPEGRPAAAGELQGTGTGNRGNRGLGPLSKPCPREQTWVSNGTLSRCSPHSRPQSSYPLGPPCVLPGGRRAELKAMCPCQLGAPRGRELCLLHVDPQPRPQEPSIKWVLKKCKIQAGSLCANRSPHGLLFYDPFSVSSCNSILTSEVVGLVTASCTEPELREVGPHNLLSPVSPAHAVSTQNAPLT